MGTDGLLVSRRLDNGLAASWWEAVSNWSHAWARPKNFNSGRMVTLRCSCRWSNGLTVGRELEESGNVANNQIL
jgi:hypothetical protein